MKNMNHMEKVAYTLGVKLGEEFYIYGDSCHRYKITKGGLFSRYEYASVPEWLQDDKQLVKLLIGKSELHTSLLTKEEKANLKSYQGKYDWIVKSNCYTCNVILGHDPLTNEVETLMRTDYSLFRGLTNGKRYPLNSLM